MVPYDVVPIEPFTCIISVLLSVDVPTRILPENSANLIVPSSSTSIDGIPEMSLTEKIVPVSVSVRENSCPDVPSNDKTEEFGVNI
jgi:hypothetical protein